MSLSIWGLGTSLPEHTMTQDEALEMTTNIVSEDERQRRLLRMLFRKSAVQNRHLTGRRAFIVFLFPGAFLNGPRRGGGGIRVFPENSAGFGLCPALAAGPGFRESGSIVPAPNEGNGLGPLRAPGRIRFPHVKQAGGRGWSAVKPR